MEMDNGEDTGVDGERGHEDDPRFRLENLHLRKIIKENHLQPIERVEFNVMNKPEDRNMVATIGKDQLNIYDNAHCGNFLDLSCHFVNQATQHSKGGDISALAWLCADENENEALLAFGTKTGELCVVSVAHVRVMRMLKEHTAEIVDLCACPTKPGWLYSLSRDGTLRLWNDFSDDSVRIWQVGPDATCMGTNDEGNVVAVGFKTGKIVYFDDKHTFTKPSLVCEESRLNSTIDCIKFVEETKIIVHSENGRLWVMDIHTGEEHQSFQVPGTTPTSAEELKSTRFGLSDCKRFVCCGNAEGAVHLFDLEKVEKFNTLSMPRIRGAVTCCGFNGDCTSVLLATDDAILWRWDFAIVAKRVPNEEKEACIS